MIKKNTMKMLLAGLALPAFLAGCNSVYMAGVTPPPHAAPPAPKFEGAPPEFTEPLSPEEFLALEELPPVPDYPDMEVEELNFAELENTPQTDMTEIRSLGELPPVPERVDYTDPEARTEVPEWTPKTPEQIVDEIMPDVEVEAIDGSEIASTPPALPRVPMPEPVVFESDIEDDDILAPTIESRPLLEIENPSRVFVPVPVGEQLVAQPNNMYQAPAPTADGLPQFIAIPQPVVPPVPTQVQQQRPTIPADIIRAPRDGDAGRVVAEAYMLDAREFKYALKGQSPDCGGAGVGIKVSNSFGDTRYNLDAEGQPCDESEVLFNGQSKVARRSHAVSGVNIDFVNADAGPRNPELYQPDPLMVYHPNQVAPQTPDEMAVASSYAPNLPDAGTLSDGIEETEVDAPYQVPPEHRKFQPGTLEATVHEWQENKKQNRVTGAKQSEQLLADLEEIQQLADGEMAMYYQQQTDELMRRLREAELKAEMAQERHMRTNERLEMTEEERQAREQAWREEQRALSAEAATLNERLVEMQDAHARLKQTYSTRERSYMEKIAKLTEDLKRAEAQAGKARKEMVLEAAKKIAEAERLAFAARLAERDQIIRRAERLRLEGDVMMQRADDLENARTVVVPGLAGEFGEEFPPTPPQVAEVENIEPAAAQPPMSKVPVVLSVQQMPLKDVFAEVFSQMRPMAGEWDIRWELSAPNQRVMHSLWTVTAETRFDEFLDFIGQKLEETQGVKLNFSRFDKNKLFIISD